MTVYDFINLNRKTLEQDIRKIIPNFNGDLDDTEIKLWILNDESLYEWAISEGVDDI